MPTWIPVSGQRILRRLKSVRAESNIQCFELESTHGSLDGPWSYLLFVVDSLQPCILTMYIAEIHEEALIGGFNPFDGATGIVLLEDEVQGLITLLEAQLDILDESQSIIDHPFQLLEESEYKYFHINKEQSSLSRKHYYYQVKPHGDSNRYDISTILLFSEDSMYPATGLYFKIMQFLNDRLQDPNFSPRDNAISRIYLTKADIRVFVELFRKHIK